VGLIIDYFGIRRSFVIFSIGLPISQIIVALGGSYANYSLMLTGRFFFGIMCESVIIAQTCYVSSWFMGK
jgi:MFS family permease